MQPSPASTPPHLLYVAWGFPPSRGGGVPRALATVNTFVRAGWDVTVLTVESRTFAEATGADPQLQHELDPRVRVVRTPSPVWSYEHDLRKWSRSRARFPELWSFARHRLESLSFPEYGMAAWRRTAEAAAVQIHRRQPVALTIGTAAPYVDFLPGYALNRRFGVPYVLDYRDAWQLDTFSGRPSSAASPSVERWERRLIRTASEVWFVNAPIRDWHAARHPDAADRMHVVENGYDASLARFSKTVRPHRDALTFGYIGTLQTVVPIREMLEGWRAAIESGAIPRSSQLHLYGYLGHLGLLNTSLVELVNAFEDVGVTYLGPVSKAAIVETYETFDALLLPLASGRYISGGKTYEYAASGLPIVSIHDPGNATTDLLTGYPGYVSAESLEPHAIATALAATERFARNMGDNERSDAQRWATRLERTAQLAPRIDALRQAVAS